MIIGWIAAIFVGALFAAWVVWVIWMLVEISKPLPGGGVYSGGYKGGFSGPTGIALLVAAT